MSRGGDSVTAASVRWLIRQADSLYWDLARSQARLGWRVVNRSTPDPRERRDLHQQVMLDLYEAATRYCPDEAAFSTYAFWWIRAGANDPSARDGAIETPPQMRSTIVKAQSYLAQGHSIEETAALLGRRVSITRKLIAADSVGAIEPSWDMADEDTCVETEAASALRSRMVLEEVRKLPADEARVVTWFYGLGGERRHSYAEISKRAGYSLNWTNRRLRAARIRLEEAIGFRMAASRVIDAIAEGDRLGSADIEWLVRVRAAVKAGDLAPERLALAEQALNAVRSAYASR